MKQPACWNFTKLESEFLFGWLIPGASSVLNHSIFFDGANEFYFWFAAELKVGGLILSWAIRAFFREIPLWTGRFGCPFIVFGMRFMRGVLGSIIEVPYNAMKS